MTRLDASSSQDLPKSRPHHRPTSLSARGEPTVWLMGASLAIAILMITGLLALVFVSGMAAFWPRSIEKIELVSDTPEFFLGEFLRDDVFTPSDAPDERRTRSLYRVGNRDTGQPTYRWVEDVQVANRSTPSGLVLVERMAWGPWLGEPLQVEELTAEGEVVVVAEGGEATLAMLNELIPQARKRLDRINSLQRGVIDRSNRERERWRLRLATAERELEQGRVAQRTMGWVAWILILCGAIGTGVLAWHRQRSEANHRPGLVVLGWCVAGAMLMAAYVERPWAAQTLSTEEVAELHEEAAQAITRLTERTRDAEQQIVSLVAENDRYRVRIIDPRTGRFAPLNRSTPTEPLRVAQIVRVVPSNDLDWWQRLAVFGDRWREFLTEDPREANTEGGVWPVIFGTVVLTVLLSLMVVPLGVIAAIYLREYAKQGVVTSVLRIAINNLAGVPSIVYGVFGLGFFCYTMGGFVDSGPTNPLPRAPWWFMVGGLIVVIATAVGMAAAGKRASVSDSEGSAKQLLAIAGAGWMAAVILVVTLAATTPYFDGFFSAKSAENIPTFRSKGILWASLTLALLTLPVVIVATEEAIAAVPGSSRQGSYGCGASRWQTTWRIVLPGALPGIMTGAILAMARGAGEVAPLMLVGAVKLSPDLPIDGTAPFLHLDRSFMHLGFHIFDLGYQSPDPEASRPLVWATTLLLVALVFLLNSTAMILRARLRRRFSGPVV